MNITIFPIELGSTTIYAEELPQCRRDERRAAERRAIDSLICKYISPTAHLDHLLSGAPIIIGSEFHISISHAADIVLLAVNPNHPIGIDIDTPRLQLLRIARRFMTAGEYSLYGQSLDAALDIWTAKEATFKAAGIPDLTIGDIHIDLAAGIATARSRRFKFSHYHFPNHTVCLTHI